MQSNEVAAAAASQSSGGDNDHGYDPELEALFDAALVALNSHSVAQLRRALAAGCAADPQSRSLPDPFYTTAAATHATVELRTCQMSIILIASGGGGWRGVILERLQIASS